MRKMLWILAAPAAGTFALLVAWRRNPRLGSGFMNRRVNPFLVEHGVAGSGRSEVGALEHVGRRSGTRRLSPVHPVPVQDGFRIVVPLGVESEWARNVLAAGHCRIQLRDTVYDLDEPVLLRPREVGDLRAGARRVYDALGFRFLLLHRFAEQPGSLQPADGLTEAGETPPDEPAPTADAAQVAVAAGVHAPEAPVAEAAVAGD